MNHKYNSYFEQLLAIANKDKFENYKNLSTDYSNYNWTLNNKPSDKSEISIPVDW